MTLHQKLMYMSLLHQTSFAIIGLIFRSAMTNSGCWRANSKQHWLENKELTLSRFGEIDEDGQTVLGNTHIGSDSARLLSEREERSERASEREETMGRLSGDTANMQPHASAEP